jgi:hypothetical protein
MIWSSRIGYTRALSSSNLVNLTSWWIDLLTGPVPFTYAWNAFRLYVVGVGEALDVAVAVSTTRLNQLEHAKHAFHIGAAARARTWPFVVGEEHQAWTARPALLIIWTENSLILCQTPCMHAPSTSTGLQSWSYKCLLHLLLMGITNIDLVPSLLK